MYVAARPMHALPIFFLTPRTATPENLLDSPISPKPLAPHPKTPRRRDTYSPNRSLVIIQRPTPAKTTSRRCILNYGDQPLVARKLLRSAPTPREMPNSLKRLSIRILLQLLKHEAPYTPAGQKIPLPLLARKSLTRRHQQQPQLRLLRPRRHAAAAAAARIEEDATVLRGIVRQHQPRNLDDRAAQPRMRRARRQWLDLAAEARDARLEERVAVGLEGDGAVDAHPRPAGRAPAVGRARRAALRGGALGVYGPAQLVDEAALPEAGDVDVVVEGALEVGGEAGERGQLVGRPRELAVRVVLHEELPDAVELVAVRLRARDLAAAAAAAIACGEDGSSIRKLGMVTVTEGWMTRPDGHRRIVVRPADAQ